MDARGGFRDITHVALFLGALAGVTLAPLAYGTAQEEATINSALAADNAVTNDLASAHGNLQGDSANASKSMNAEEAAAGNAKTDEEKDFHLLAFGIIALKLQALQAENVQLTLSVDAHEKLHADLTSLIQVQHDIDTGGPLLQLRSDKDKDAVGAAGTDLVAERKNANGMVDLAKIEGGDIQQRDNKIFAILMDHINKKDSFAPQARTLLARNQEVGASLMDYLNATTRLSQDIMAFDVAVVDVYKSDHAGLHMPMSQ